MRKRLTLEPEILQYLAEHGTANVEILIDYLSKKTGVENEKVRFRIEKMVSQKKLKSVNRVISMRSSGPPEVTNQYDEVFEYGPIRLTRKGKVVQIQSNWEKGAHEAFLTRVEEELPRLREDIQKKVRSIEEKIIKDYDPLDILAYVSAKNILTDPETYAESSFEGKQWYPEFIQNLILRNDYSKYKEKINREKIPEIEKDLKELFNDFIWYTQFEAGARKNLSEIEREILVTVLLWRSLVRGPAYPQHIKLIATELFDRAGVRLEGNGFSIGQYFETIEEIERQINRNYNEPRKRLAEEHQKFLEYVRLEENKGVPQKQILENYHERIESRRKELWQDFEKLSEIMLKGSFVIETNDKTNRKLLDSISLRFGDNSSWSQPLDASEISLKPIIRVGETYYCFLVPLLFWNVVPIIENMMTEDEKTQLRYYEKKSDFFENKVLSLFENCLKGSEVFSNLHYTIVEEGVEKWPEIDGIIVYGKSLLLVEVKAKGKREIGGRRDVLTLTESDLKKNIGDAFNQSKRAHDYICKNEIAIFEKDKGKPALELRRSGFSNIFLVNVTGESFQTFATDLNSLKLFRSKLLEGEIYPYVINMYDLIVITDLLTDGDDLIEYLKQRVRISENPEIRAYDELDFFGYFLEHGSLGITEEFKDLQGFLVHGYSEKIDRWYSYQRGEVASAERPALKRKNR